jgi:thioredoxin-dependent peroxiredoxin
LANLWRPPMSKPEVGDLMPDVPLEKFDGGSVKPSDFAGRRAVMFFYPKDMTPGCTTEAIDFSTLKPRFDEANVAVLGISKDSPDRHRKFAEKHGLTIELATDAAEGGLSDALGIWTEKQLYGKRFMGMVRTTYLLGADRRIERIWDKVKVKGHAEEVLAAATA